MPKKIIRNLQFGVGLSLLILIASSIASYVSIQNQMENRESLSKSRRSITAVKDVLIALLDAETGDRGYQLTGKENYLEPYNRSLIEFPKAIERAKNLQIDDPNQLKRLNQLEQNVNENMEHLKKLVENKHKGILLTQDQMMTSKFYMDQCRKLVQDFVQYEEKQLEIKNKSLNLSSTTTVIFIVLSAIAALVVTVFFYIKLRNDLIRREKLEKELKAKDLEITRRVSAIQQIANRVANGDYSQKVVDNSEDDLGDLVGSLNHMTDSLKKSFDKINKSDWRQKGLAMLNESLVGNNSVKEVTDNALNQLIEYGKCINGAIYLMDDGVLKLSKAVGLEDAMKKVFEPGEGMIGQVFKSKKTRIFNDLDDNDFAVTFAGSKMKIDGILLAPIMLGRECYGVMELNSATNFDQDRIEYCVEGTRNIAIALSAAKAREKEQRLLEETQAQAEELQMQHSELENLNTELEAQTQKLQASEEELRVQQEELMQTNSELEERSKLLEEKNHLIAERNIEIQKKAEELALSTKYKSEFLANMSHELRTPLNSILLLSRLMAENPEENLNEDQVESAKVIQSSGSSLLTLIDEILDLAKIESGKMTLEYQDVVIQEVVKDLQDLFNPLVHDKGIRFDIDINEQLSESIETDRLRLDQVLRNLLSNALKFTSEGSIGLQVRKDPKHSNFITFSVKDTGIGIPEEKQHIIFEAFQQADGSTRRKFGGTGLGLSISREIARLLGGELTLKSKVNEGSEFTLSIPINALSKEVHIQTDQDLVEIIQEDVQEIKHILDLEEPQPAKPSVVLEIPEDVDDDRDNIAEGDKVILIIEDDTHFAKALLKYAHMQHYKGVVVVRGDHALSAALQYRPSAILLDVQLPVRDGWQVMDELKNHLQTKHIPVHMMSSLQVKKESLMRGAIDFINKPVALEQMTDVFKKIEEALRKSPQKVLIVEENAKHASALHYFLSNFNISLSVEDNVEDSVKALTSDEVDCVILDVGPARGNEYKIIEAIKSYEGLENLPIIIFTERNLSKSEELKIRQYADSIVVKTAHSYQRILDEVGLFLHLVEEKNSSPEITRSKTLGSLTEVLSGKKILITDDDVRNIFSLTKALEKYKVEVVLAMDGKQALEQIKVHPDIDVILMDMMMPEMDGYETIRQIRKMPMFTRLPVIAVTAKSMIGEREKCITAGASDYISKPVDIDQLLSLLRVWLYES
ncbi:MULTISPECIES: response regulator [Chryseobacterium]|uniref:histidine kinase n=1 Tax=Chryseobacterium camelliae TaxID=1265445 RepID=A0ABU0TD18_9FLAO|nr:MULTISPECIES: response regulator [Chryseobacterium]MDT3407242.1 signal transduction histidine kinase/DNA-binding response OmpR family regulator/CHASE3 domain sensor protein [Pseudacidovorax intermedius]MDQ1094969.1 signal transduction histidine kinase/DNA-binding response OmpR family regulator/CHASE3 domain sensor protein [Chryseobacterium camelliae]MDQ1098908.1 signal transduction histidine kinase/DNA-binding response OmpR family regulator/CHASE3 domain sensor protein [Chryseobacterium sp. S